MENGTEKTKKEIGTKRISDSFSFLCDSDALGCVFVSQFLLFTRDYLRVEIYDLFCDQKFSANLKKSFLMKIIQIEKIVFNETCLSKKNSSPVEKI